MKVETAITITLTKEEQNAVKTVHNMLANLSPSDYNILNNALPTSVYLEKIQEGLNALSELTINGYILN